MSENSEKPGAKLSPQTSLWLAVGAAITGFAAVYGTMGGADNAANTSPAPATAEKTATAPPSSAEPGAATASKLAAFVRKNPPEALAEISFVDATGAAKTLADFKGKTVLLNLWATWCAPCREEMPSLDRLQKQLGSETFEVVALAVDRTGVEAAGKFLKSINVENLKLYADPTTKSGTALRVLGMPTTILITPDGKEAGRLSGPAAWDSDEAKKLIEAARK
jgi:thiol-disulfide isomerase/thioredoxin